MRRECSRKVAWRYERDSRGGRIGTRRVRVPRIVIVSTDEINIEPIAAGSLIGWHRLFSSRSERYRYGGRVGVWRGRGRGVGHDCFHSVKWEIGRLGSTVADLVEGAVCTVKHGEAFTATLE